MDCNTPSLPVHHQTPRVCSNSCPLSRWCHPTISFSVAHFSSCPQYFPASGSFPMSRLFVSGGQSIGAVLCLALSSVQFNRSVMSDSLRSHELQHTRPPCPSPNSQSSLKLTSIKSVMPSSHLILYCPLLLLYPIPPSIRVFSNESTLHNSSHSSLCFFQPSISHDVLQSTGVSALA